MSRTQVPRWRDVLIERVGHGFWMRRTSAFEAIGVPQSVDSLDTAVAVGGRVACLEQVDLWLIDESTEPQLLVSCRRASATESDRG